MVVNLDLLACIIHGQVLRNHRNRLQPARKQACEFGANLLLYAISSVGTTHPT